MLFSHGLSSGTLARGAGRAPATSYRFARVHSVGKRSRSSRLVAAAAAAERLDAQVCVVLGTQWGDEGKGKLVDILAQQYDIVARAQV